MQIHITTTGCSETPWGLRFQMEGSGLCTRLIVFTSVEAGTVELSLSLHASRQLSDKVLRYLKRVIVTPAVYRSFDRLKPDFRCRHWAGFGPNTHPFELAGTYVFTKQSDFSCHCDQ